MVDSEECIGNSQVPSSRDAPREFSGMRKDSILRAFCSEPTCVAKPALSISNESWALNKSVSFAIPNSNMSLKGVYHFKLWWINFMFHHYKYQERYAPLHLPYPLSFLLSCVWLFGTPWTYTEPRILLARIMEWVAFSFSEASSRPRDQTQVSHIVGRFFTSWANTFAYFRCPWHLIDLLKR